MNWYKKSINNASTTKVSRFITEKELLDFSKKANRTWSDIRNEYDQKYGKNHHHLRLICVRCGNKQTCRCKEPKITEIGVCDLCFSKYNDKKAEIEDNMNFLKEASISGFLRGLLPMGAVSVLVGLGLSMADLQNKPVRQIQQEIVQRAEEQGYSEEAINLIERSVEIAQEKVTSAVEPLAQQVAIPNFKIYTIQPNDTLTFIAKKELGSPLLWKEIVKLNPGIAPEKLKPGQKIKIPSVPQAKQPVAKPTTRPTTQPTTEPTTQPAKKEEKKIEETKISDPKLAELKPEFKSKVENVLKDLKAKGWQPKIAEGLRTLEQQKEKVQKGYSKTMNSAHLKGYGADIIDSRYGWSGPAAKLDYKFWKDLGEAAKKQGLVWGGDWKFVDVGHVEYPGWKDKK
jgi:LysM repeat protein